MVEIRGTTGVLCVIGHPIAHSFSPQMHNAAIASLGMNLCYVAFHVAPEGVERAVEGMRGLGILGMNVTVPHKQAVMPFLDDVSEEARLVGAVNTIKNEGGRLSGYNSDVYGIVTSLRETAGLRKLPPKAAVLGASGAARGVVYGLAMTSEVKDVAIFNRTPSRAENLADEMAGVTGKSVSGWPLDAGVMKGILSECGLLVNATSAGMHPNVGISPLPDSSVLHPGLVVYDTVFNPRTTLLLRQAEAAGCQAFGGIEMLVYQGAKSFEIWTGVAPPVEIMKRAVGA
jgi:shikimate dehydrogenase